jgi:tight adherence protein B
MTALILGLILALLLAGGIFGALFIQTRGARREIARRTDLIAKEVPTQPRADRPDGLLQRLATTGAWFRRRFAFGLPYRWGMRAGPTLLILIGIAGAATAWLLLRVLFHLPLWLVLPLTLGGFVFTPRRLLKHQQDVAEQAFLNLFPDAIDMVVRMVRAGLPIMAAIRTVGDEAPAPVNAVFASLADRVEIGVLFDEALVEAGARIGLSDFRFFAVAVSLQHATGGNIAATLEVLSDIIRKRRAARLRAKATTAEVRVSAFVLGSLPFVVIGGLAIMSPAYLAPLVTDPRGNAIIGAAIVLLSSGFLTMRQMMRHATQV